MLRQNDVHGILRRDVLDAFIAEFSQVDPGEKVLSEAKENRGNSEVQLVDQPRAKILPYCRYSATEPDILTIRRLGGSLECSVDTVSDKIEGCTAGHRNRCTWVVGKHKDRTMIRGYVSPPAVPCIVGPVASDRPEHITSHDPRSDVVEASRSESVINASRTSVTPEHFSKSTGSEGPFVKRNAAGAKRIVEILVGTRAIAVEGNREALNAELW